MKSISEKKLKAVIQWLKNIQDSTIVEAFICCNITEDLDNYKTVVTIDDILSLFEILNIKTITKKEKKHIHINTQKHGPECEYLINIIQES